MTGSFSATPTEQLSDLTIVHHVEDDGVVWATSNRQIYRIAHGKRQPMGKFPLVFPRDLFGFHRLAQRAARADKCNIFVNRNGQVLETNSL